MTSNARTHDNEQHTRGIRRQARERTRQEHMQRYFMPHIDRYGRPPLPFRVQFSLFTLLLLPLAVALAYLVVEHGPSTFQFLRYMVKIMWPKKVPDFLNGYD